MQVYDKDLFNNIDDLVDFYIKLANLAGILVEDDMGFDAECVIVSPDVADELFLALLKSYIRQNASIIFGSSTQREKEDVLLLAQATLHEALQQYGPFVDDKLESHSIIVVEGFITAKNELKKSEPSSDFQFKHHMTPAPGKLN